jgi:TctA family transporter
MVFYVVMENTKVVANLLIYTRPNGLGVMTFKSLLSGFAYALNRSVCLVCLTCVHMESGFGDNRRSVLLFLSFPKCPIALILVV